MNPAFDQRDATATSDDRFRRKAARIEVAVFLFLIVPSMAFSFFAVSQGSVSFVLVSAATMLRDLSLVALVVFFLWRNREKVSSLGWTLRRGWREVGIGAALFVPTFFGAATLEHALRQVGLTAPSTPLPGLVSERGWSEVALALVLVLVVAWAEETIFRGYLLLRFASVTRSRGAAVLLAATVFSVGHGYEGTAGVITVWAIGVAFAIVYLWRKTLIAPIVMHFLQDFVGIVLPPLLAMS